MLLLLQLKKHDKDKHRTDHPAGGAREFLVSAEGAQHRVADATRAIGVRANAAGPGT
jgi:hypothetical protein